MEKITIKIDTPFIPMDKLLKLTNIVGSGGEAHIIIVDGYVSLNGVVISEKRKKVYPGHIVTVDDKYTIEVL